MFDNIPSSIVFKTLVLVFLAIIIVYLIVKSSTKSGAFNLILYLFAINIMNLFIIESIPIIIIGSFIIYFILVTLVNYYVTRKN